MAPVDYGTRQHDALEAMRRLPLPQPSRSAARAALDADESLKDFLLQSLDMKAGRWVLNLEVLAAEMPKIFGWPQPGGHYDGPALFLSGGASDYVLPEHRPAIKAMFPRAKFAKLPGAGHFLHAEKPAAFEAAVRSFLESEAV